MNSKMNDTDLGEITVLRGKKNYKDVGRVVTVNGETGEVSRIFSSMNFFSLEE